MWVTVAVSVASSMVYSYLKKCAPKEDFASKTLFHSSSYVIYYFVVGTRRPRLQAGIIGAGAGVAVLVVFLVGYAAYKRGWARRLLGLRPNTTPDVMSYSAASESVRTSSLGSANSGSSDEAPRPRLHLT